MNVLKPCIYILPVQAIIGSRSYNQCLLNKKQTSYNQKKKVYIALCIFQELLKYNGKCKTATKIGRYIQPSDGRYTLKINRTLFNAVTLAFDNGMEELQTPCATPVLCTSMLDKYRNNRYGIIKDT